MCWKKEPNEHELLLQSGKALNRFKKRQPASELAKSSRRIANSVSLPSGRKPYPTRQTGIS